MSISVSFTTKSKRENSTKQRTMSATHDCVFKNGCDLLTPTLLLELDRDTFPNYTGFKIENRYYFITDMRSVRQNLFEVSGRIDALATYKANILGSTQYVSYSSSKTSIWLPDTRIPIQKNASVTEYSSTMNFLFNDTGFYVLSVIGDNSNGQNGCQVLCTDKTQLFKMIDDVSSWTGDLVNSIKSALPFASPTTELQAYQNFTEAIVQTGAIGNAYLDAPNCIRSCLWVPFFLSSFAVGGYKNINLGAFETAAHAYECQISPISNTVTLDIPWQFSDWRRALCEDLYLYLPLVGMVNIPSDELINDSQLTIQYAATAVDGCVAYRIVSSTGQVIGTYGANCGANYPIGISQQASAGEIVQTAWQGIEKTVSSGIRASGAKTQTGKTLGITNTVFNAVDTAYDTIDTAMTRHNSCIGGISGAAGVGLSLDAKIYSVAHPTVIAPDTMEATMGLPTMKPMPLTNLTGYCQCANAHIDAPATDTELSIIDNYLNSGFFIE